MFVELEDAMEWGLRRFGSNGFRIGYVSLDELTVQQQQTLAGAPS